MREVFRGRVKQINVGGAGKHGSKYLLAVVVLLLFCCHANLDL
jgi:hypothetical protein